MTGCGGSVVAGVDAHTDEHHVAVVDVQGRLLGAAGFPATAEGYAGLISWVRKHGEVDRVGVESTGAYAAGSCGRCMPPRATDERENLETSAVVLPSKAGAFGSGRMIRAD
jgi:hypothetical protein